jgi:hypothetical protein
MPNWQAICPSKNRFILKKILTLNITITYRDTFALAFILAYFEIC